MIKQEKLLSATPNRLNWDGLPVWQFASEDDLAPFFSISTTQFHDSNFYGPKRLLSNIVVPGEFTKFIQENKKAWDAYIKWITTRYCGRPPGSDFYRLGMQSTYNVTDKMKKYKFDEYFLVGIDDKCPKIKNNKINVNKTELPMLKKKEFEKYISDALNAPDATFSIWETVNANYQVFCVIEQPVIVEYLEVGSVTARKEFLLVMKSEANSKAPFDQVAHMLTPMTFIDDIEPEDAVEHFRQGLILNYTDLWAEEVVKRF